MNTGVYQIRNLINNDLYVGSAALSFDKRWRCHKSTLKKNKHRNIHLQRAWNKYGAENFIFEIIELTEPNLCLLREQYYLDTLKPRYNLSPTASSLLGYKHSAETRLKSSLAHKGRPAWNKGLKFSDESRKKMSESKKIGFKNGTIKSFVKGKKFPRNKPILREDGKIYPNIMTAAIDLNVKENTVIKACTDFKQIRRVRGFLLKYIKND